MNLPGALVVILGCLCVLDLTWASPNKDYTSDSFQRLESSIEKLGVTVDSRGTESAEIISDAIRSHQQTLQQFFSAFLSQTDSRCQSSEIVSPTLNETKHEDKHMNSTVEEKFEEIVEGMQKLMGKMEGIDDLLRALEDRSQKPSRLDFIPLWALKLGWRELVYVSKRGEKMTWGDARDFCRSHGGELAMSSIATLLPEALSSETSGVFWLGGSDLETEGDFRWLSGDKVDGGWHPGQPNRGDENCLAHAVDLPGLHDYPCESERRFICSRE